MLEPVCPPLALRVRNQLGAGLRAVGLEPVSLHPARLKERAGRQTNLHDFGDESFEEGLEVLCRSAEQDAYLTDFGRRSVREHITHALATRLMRWEVHKKTPEIFQTQLRAPLVVVGLPRSGSTMLQHLLAEDPANRALRFWELRQPIPAQFGGSDDRRSRAISQVAMMRRIAPSVDAKRIMDADAPEECSHLLDSSLASFSFWMFAPVHGYLEWLLTQDLQGPYRAYREHLQLFQTEVPDKRFLLKAPAHSPYLDALLGAIPSAMIVQTHRDPGQAANSINSLMYTLHSIVSSKVDVRRLARSNVAFIDHQVQRGLALRATIPNSRLIDVRYTDILEHPLETVQHLYDHFGLEFSPEFEQRLIAWVATRADRRLERHTHTPEEFGLSMQELDQRFQPYVDYFLGEEAALPLP